MSTGLKRCSRCATEKELAAFNGDRSKPDGLFRWCRECSKAAKREAYRANPEHFKKQVRASHARNASARSVSRKAKYDANREANLARARAYREQNVDTVRQRARAYYHANRDAVALRSKARRYGIDAPAMAALITASGGLCAICKKAPSRGRASVLHVDHCHRTGKVRGLLCHLCNVGVGHFEEDADRMKEAIRYLQSHAAG